MKHDYENAKEEMINAYLDLDYHIKNKPGKRMFEAINEAAKEVPGLSKIHVANKKEY